MTTDQLRANYVQILQLGTTNPDMDADIAVTEKTVETTDAAKTEKKPITTDTGFKPEDKKPDQGYENEVTFLDISITTKIRGRGEVNGSVYYGNVLAETWSMTTSQGGAVKLDAFIEGSIPEEQGVIKLIQKFRALSESAGESDAIADNLEERKATAKLGMKVRQIYRTQIFGPGGKQGVTSDPKMLIEFNGGIPTEDKTGTGVYDIQIKAQNVGYAFLDNLDVFKDFEQTAEDMGYRVNPATRDTLQEFTEHTPSGPRLSVENILRVAKKVNPATIQNSVSTAAKETSTRSIGIQSAMEQLRSQMDDPAIAKSADPHTAMIAALTSEKNKQAAATDASMQVAKMIQENENDKTRVLNANNRAEADKLTKDADNRSQTGFINSQAKERFEQSKVDNLATLARDAQSSWKENAEAAKESTKATSEFEYRQRKQMLQQEIQQIQAQLSQANLYQGNGMTERIQNFQTIQSSFMQIVNSLNPDEKNSLAPTQFAEAARQAFMAAPDYKENQAYYDNLKSRLLNYIGGNGNVIKDPGGKNIEAMRQNAQKFFTAEQTNLEAQKANFLKQGINVDKLQRQLVVSEQELAALDSSYIGAARATDQKSAGNIVGQKVDGLAKDRYTRQGAWQGIKNTATNVYDKVASNFQQGGKLKAYRDWLKQHTH